MMASFKPVSDCACFSRDEYGLRSTNLSGSVDEMSPSKVSYWLSSINCASRVRASIRKCFSHFGQTFMFSSRSFFQMIWRQLSHFTHSPSVRTFFSPEVSNSTDSRLNQAIVYLVIESFNHLGNENAGSADMALTKWLND